MKYYSIHFSKIPVQINVSCFGHPSGTQEFHLILTPTRSENIETQIHWITRAYRKILIRLKLKERHAIFRRFFCSDLINQNPLLNSQEICSFNPKQPCALSLCGQSPAGNAKLALWCYFIKDPRQNLIKQSDHETVILKRGKLSHYWTGHQPPSQLQGSYEQTDFLLKNYLQLLKRHRMSLANHVMRTWFIIKDIDTQYKGLVEARRKIFTRQGLTSKTHYIASTGIGGIHSHPETLVDMSAYAIKGIQPSQIKYLSAPDFLSPTHLYGVTFERGVAIDYRDRRHIFLSGTASINHKGEIVCGGDVVQQLKRIFENMTALLRVANATLRDLGIVLVYLRDFSDTYRILPLLKKYLRSIPHQILQAPVCRPGWLIELEGMAILPISQSKLPPF